MMIYRKRGDKNKIKNLFIVVSLFFSFFFLMNHDEIKLFQIIKKIKYKKKK